MVIENKNVDFFNSKTGNYLILTSYGKVILAKVDNVIVDSTLECYPTAPVFYSPDCSVTVQGNPTKRFDVDKALKTLGFAKAYSDTQVALQNVEEEVNQLEKYKSFLKSNIERLKEQLCNEERDLDEFMTWYEKVTKFDEKSYNVWIKMKCECPHFPQWEES